jgi:Sulfotransferase family
VVVLNLRSLRWRRRTAGRPAPFVVSSPRSGSTLLRMMLDAHRELAIPSETHFIPDLIAAFDAGRPSAEEAVRMLREHRRWDDFHLSEPELLSRMREHEPLTAGDAIRSFFALYAQSQGKPRWGDKTPEYVEHMREIERVVPEARFIHVIRDGRDVALSRTRWRLRRVGRKPPVERLARKWRRAITVARKQGGRLGHYMEVRYEDLIADTEPTLRRICEFAELEFDPGMLRYHEGAAERLAEIAHTLPEREDRTALAGEARLSKHEMTTKPPERTRIFAWRSEMSQEDLATFEREAGDLLAELDYPVGEGARERATAAAEG